MAAPNPITAGVLHSAAALHHLQQLAAADTELHGSGAFGLEQLQLELTELAESWQQLADAEHRRRLAQQLGLDCD